MTKTALFPFMKTAEGIREEEKHFSFFIIYILIHSPAADISSFSLLLLP